MTASPAEDQRAAQGQAAGEAAEARHMADAQAQHATAGSAVAVEAGAPPDDVSVSCFGSGADVGQANVQPSTPPATNSFDRDTTDRT
jgi:hypothetical protein